MAELKAPESRDVDVRVIALVGTALAAIVVICAVALLGLRTWLARDRPGAGPFTEPSAVRQFVAPRLQPAPGRDIAALDQEKAAKLHRYRWIDRSHGVVQIPIERAMELMSQRTSR
jgi:hypothetical protein